MGAIIREDALAPATSQRVEAYKTVKNRISLTSGLSK